MRETLFPTTSPLTPKGTSRPLAAYRPAEIFSSLFRRLAVGFGKSCPREKRSAPTHSSEPPTLLSQKLAGKPANGALCRNGHFFKNPQLFAKNFPRKGTRATRSAHSRATPGYFFPKIFSKRGGGGGRTRGFSPKPFVNPTTRFP
jgi:hypothetical protein